MGSERGREGRSPRAGGEMEKSSGDGCGEMRVKEEQARGAVGVHGMTTKQHHFLHWGCHGLGQPFDIPFCVNCCFL